MTLEEAIIHCKEKACDNTQCAIEHRQLAEWLEELKEYRKTARKERPEVDLELEIERIVNDEEEFMNFQAKHQLIGYVARHFYELGLNARKEE